MTPHGREFFLSKTTLKAKQYPFDCIRWYLENLGVTPACAYVDGELVVLRSTVMNPVHDDALRTGKDYLYDFLLHLHKTACVTVDQCIGKSMRNT